MEPTNVRLVDRVLDVMETLSRHPEGTSIAVLTAETDIHKSTVYRLLATLMNRGYVVKDEETSHYRLTLRTYRIGSRAVPDFDLLSLSVDYLRELCRLCNEAVHLAIPDGASIVYLFKEVAADNVIRIASQTGARNYMYYTGLGKALLATMSEKEVREIWEKSDVKKYTPTTIITYPQLLEELETTRRRGYAIDNEEHEAGIACIADVIRDVDNKAVAAVSISTLAARLDDNFLALNVPRLHKTANKISAILGNVLPKGD
nr:IclR family transcriptional regulator [uncultured Marvinbryantia sp.]